ncbi:MAG: hypothetical protein AAF944_26805 [Bacteroidota bacterium]
MEISPELLRRYLNGECSPEERRQVERYLEAEKNKPSDLPDAQAEKMKVDFWQNISAVIQASGDLATGGPKGNTTGSPAAGLPAAGPPAAPIISLRNRVTRYAAVACLVIGAFFLGFFASPNAQADTVKQSNQLTDVLHIYGGNGAYGMVAGNRYRVKFAGKLRVRNSANEPKQIVCGEQEFTLEPHRTYFLTGSDQQARITNESSYPDAYNLRKELIGGFTFLKLD